jgi:hypothetical protein
MFSITRHIGGSEFEAEDYLRGILWADKDIRLNEDIDVKQIDPWGTGTKAFWRGFIETAGTVSMTSAGASPNGTDYEYPRVEIKETIYPILRKFLDFMQEEMMRYSPLQWDEDGKFEWQAKGGFLRITGYKAKDIVRTLYISEVVGRESVRRVVDRIVIWTGRAK